MTCAAGQRVGQCFEGAQATKKKVEFHMFISVFDKNKVFFTFFSSFYYYNDGTRIFMITRDIEKSTTAILSFTWRGI
jgi:hypothetical protein